MTPRQIARVHLALRALLMRVLVARAYGVENAAQEALAQMDATVASLPFWLRTDAALSRYVQAPVDRWVDRHGVLAAAQRVKWGRS